MKDLLDYLKWIHTDVNPQRKALGFKKVSIYQAVKSYIFIKKFWKDKYE